jgi:hypothetical protein
MVGPELVDFRIVVAQLIELIADTSPETGSLLSQSFSDVCAIFSFFGKYLSGDSSSNFDVAHPPKTERGKVAH